MKKAKENKLTEITLPDYATDLISLITSDVITIIPARFAFPKFGISEGDKTIVQKVAEYHENELSVFRIADTTNAHIGYFYDNFGDVGIIDGDGKTHRYKRKEVTPFGIVIGVIKPYKQVAEESERERIELTLTCSDCGKQITGNRKILLASGWAADGETWLCLNCDLKND